MHPDLENIFFQSMIYPPEHLLKSVAEVRKRFDLLNLKFFRQLLQTVDLRPEISEQEAAEGEQGRAEQGEPQAQGHHGLFHARSSPARR